MPPSAASSSGVSGSDTETSGVGVTSWPTPFPTRPSPKSDVRDTCAATLPRVGPMSLAVVTGASRGIGRALVERLLSEGDDVVSLSRTGDAVAGSPSYALDVADPEAVAEVFGRIEAEHGVPDLLVNNAALSGGSARTLETSAADWWRVLEVNVRGTELCSRAVLPGMIERRSGRIVNVSSGAATYPIGLGGDERLSSAYMASKAAVNRFTEALAGEVHAGGVRVFALSPGTVKTDMTAEVFADAWDDEELWTPVERSVQLVVDLASGALDALSGRYVRAASDDWHDLARRADEVVRRDLQVQRLVTG